LPKRYRFRTKPTQTRGRFRPRLGRRLKRRSIETPPFGRPRAAARIVFHSEICCRSLRARSARKRPGLRRQFGGLHVRLRGRRVPHACGADRNIHSRQIANNAAKMTGPTKGPMRPNAASPPKMPTNASRKGSLTEPLNSVGQTK
jgi:hypothetical protein